MPEDLNDELFQFLKAIRPFDGKPNLYRAVNEGRLDKSRINLIYLTQNLLKLEELGYLNIWNQEKDQDFRRRFPNAPGELIEEDDIMVALDSSARSLTDHPIKRKLRGMNDFPVAASVACSIICGLLSGAVGIAIAMLSMAPK